MLPTLAGIRGRCPPLKLGNLGKPVLGQARGEEREGGEDQAMGREEGQGEEAPALDPIDGVSSLDLEL